MLKNQGTRYSVTLSPPMEEDLEALTQELHTTKAEVIRRSLTLFKHAIRAGSVELHKDEDGRDVVQKVLLR